MKITVEQYGDSGLSLEEFADKHGLEMKVTERSKRSELNGKTLPRYSASFYRVEVMDAGCLTSSFGSGASVEEAIKDYALQIEGTRIVHMAFSDSRKEINVPNRLPLQDEDSRLEGTRFR